MFLKKRIKTSSFIFFSNKKKEGKIINLPYLKKKKITTHKKMWEFC